LVPGALMHLSNPELKLDGLAIVLSEAGKGRRKGLGCGHNVLFRGEVVTFFAASTPTKLLLSARINPHSPSVYYTFKPILLAGAPHDTHDLHTTENPPFDHDDRGSRTAQL